MRSYCISNPKIGFEVPILLIHIEERLGLKFGFSKPIFGFELLAGVKLFTTSIPIFGLYLKNFSQCRSKDRRGKLHGMATKLKLLSKAIN